MTKKALCAIITVIPLLLCFGCAKSGCVYYSKTFFSMDTVMEITVYNEREERANELFSLCYDEILRQENLFSVSVAASDISKLNASGGESAEVAPETVSLIEKAVSVSELTGGAFDITVYPAVKLWGFYGGEHNVPNRGEIADALTFIGYKNIEFTGGVRLRKGMGIDLGGIAKGYLGDSLKSLLEKNGVKSAVISLGGNITLVGDKPDKKSWSVAVRSPFSQDEYICRLSVSGGYCVVTSGAYERYFEKDGKTYHHIIDPKTGYPAQSDLASVTVIGEDGCLCDALSTALFVMGKEKALAFLLGREDLSYVLVLEGGEVIMSDDVKE